MPSINRPAVVNRLPVRARTAAAAALAAVLMLTLGGWWLRQELYASKMADALHQARMTLSDATIVYSWSDDPDLPDHIGNAASRSLLPVIDTPWVLIDPAGRFVEGDPALQPFVPHPLGVLPASARGMITQSRVRLTAPPGGPPFPLAVLYDDLGGLKGRQLTVVSTVIRAAGLTEQGKAPVQALTLHVLVSPVRAEVAVAAVDRLLLLGIPAAALLVALIVWTTTSWALRPVDAIQRRLRTITGEDLSLRVPVPARQDEIGRLARTTNETLDRLERAVSLQRRFTADASHELRTPLATMRTELEVALHYPNRAEWAQVAQGLLADTERLQALTDDLLLLAQLDSADPPPSGLVHLAGLAGDVVTRAARHAPDRVHLSCTATGDPVVRGDARRLERLLSNLVNNAVRHCRTRVDVEVTARDGLGVLEVRDDGPGVPAEYQGSIFERFTRFDTSRDRGTGGSGLGLAIAREIATAHQGTLVLRSDARAGGARFVAEFPLAEFPLAEDQLAEDHLPRDDA